MKRTASDSSKPQQVGQLMNRAVSTCRPDEPLNAAARIMWEHDCGIVPITVNEEGGERVVGMLSDRDICMAAYTQGRALSDVPIASAMSHGVRACHPEDTIDSALDLMAAEQLHRLPVVDASEHLVGLLSLADIAREALRSPHGASSVALAHTVEALSMPRPHDVVVAA